MSKLYYLFARNSPITVLNKKVQLTKIYIVILDEFGKTLPPKIETQKHFLATANFTDHVRSLYNLEMIVL